MGRFTLYLAASFIAYLSTCTADDLFLSELSDVQGDVSAFLPVVQPLGDLSVQHQFQSDDSSTKADIVIVYHLSTKISVSNIPKYIIPFLKSILEKATGLIDSGDVRISLINFAKRPRTKFNLAKFKTSESILKQISSIGRKDRAKFGNGANALKEVRTKIFTAKGGDRPDAANYVIFIMDNKSWGNTKAFLQEAQKLKATGAKIFTVGMNNADGRNLASVASDATENAVYVREYKNIASPEVVDPIRSFVGALQGPVAAIPTVPTEAPVIRPGSIVRPGLSIAGKEQADIVFAIHFDPRRSNAEFDLLVAFLQSVIATSDVSGRKVRFGLYLDGGIIKFNLKDYQTNLDLARAIATEVKRSDARAQKFDLVKILTDTRQRMFTAQAGDRPGVDNALVIISDTNSRQDARQVQLASRRAAEANIAIYTLGIGLPDKGELVAVASSDNNVFAFSDYNDLKSYDEQLRKEISAFDTRIAEEIARPVPTRGPALTRGPAPSKLVKASADIVIAFHFDPSGGDLDFNYLISFLQSLISTSDVDGKQVRFALYINGGIVKFSFDKYSTNAEIAQALKGLSRSEIRSRKFDLKKLLIDMWKKVFKTARPGVDKKLVIVTDTRSGTTDRILKFQNRKIKKAKIDVYTVGIGKADVKELATIASAPGKALGKAADYRSLGGYGAAMRRSLTAMDTRAAPAVTTRVAPTTPKPTVRVTPRPVVRSTLPPALSDCGLARADLIIVIDSSTSVTEANFAKVRTFVKDLISKADIDSGNVRVGVVIYSTSVYQIFQLNTYKTKREILRAVDNIPFRFGRTNTAGALRAMRLDMFTPINGDRPNIPNIAVVLTDGVSTENAERTLPEAMDAYRDGIHIYTIGVGLTDTRELDGIATRPASENSFKVANFDDLQQVDDIMFAKACPKIFTMPPPTRPATDAPRTWRPRPTRAPTTRRPTTRRPTTRRTTTTRRPTTPRRIPPKIQETGTDLVFMMDSSVDDRTFGQMKTFVTDFTNQIDMSRGEWQIGGMTFDSRARANFHLNRYNFPDEIVNGLSKLRSKQSRTKPDVAGAFDYVRRSMFQRRQGDRIRARNYVVLLTGNEEFLNSERGYAAANRLKDLGTDIYTVGFNFDDPTELDRISSQPPSEYRTIISSSTEAGEIPGVYLYHMANAPPPTTRAPTTTTTTTTTRRPILPVGSCKSRADVVFLLDTSGSVGEYNYALMRNFTYNIIHDLDVDNGAFRIGIATFSDTSRVEFQLNTYTIKKDILNAMTRMPYVYGHTNTADALRRVRTEMFTTRNGDRPDIANLLVIITDGHSNIHHDQTIPESRLIKNMGTSVFAVAIGIEDNSELRGIASQPVDQNVIEVKDFSALGTLENAILQPLCTDADMCAGNPCRNEGVCVDGLGSYICVCTGGFYGDNCEHPCGDAADVVLILDSSTSVGRSNFNIIKRYAQRLVHDMEILNCGVNIGVMKYSSAAMIQFPLGAYDTGEEVMNAISYISYTPGRANMAHALMVLRTQMFTGFNGDRHNVRNIAYLITDGAAEINRDITLSEAERVIDSGIRLIPLAVGLRERSEIEFISNAQGFSLMEVENEEKFVTMNDQILEAVHDTDDHCAGNPCMNGAECVSGSLGFTCKCREGFTGDTCENTCNAQADIVFVIDSSRYNSGPEFRSIKRFLRDLVKEMAFRGDRFQVGVVEYGSSPNMRLSLQDGNNKRTVKSVIGSLRRVRGDPDTSRAVSLVEYNMFGARGDRKHVPNYMVLLTRSMRMSSLEAINKLKAKGTKVIGVGVGLSAQERMYMESAVSAPHLDTLFMADQVEDLTSLTQSFTDFVCQERNMCENNPCQNGGICENGEKTYVCKCPSGYAGKDCTRTCDDRADIVFLIDSSGSVGWDNFGRIKEYISMLISNLNIGPDATQVGVATFSTSSRAHIYLDSYHDKRRLQSAVDSINYVYGNTNTASGTRLARSILFSEDRGNRRDVPDFLFIITDGLSNVNHEATIPEAEKARAEGIHVFAIGVGIGDDDWELRGMASKPAKNNVFRVDSWDGLWDISESLINGACRDSAVCDGDPCQNGGKCIAGPTAYTCECRDGFIGENCELDCTSVKDITFVVDASTSVGPTNFQKQLDYVGEIIKDLTLGGQDHHFALITYSTKVSTIFTFNRYGSSEDIISATKTTTYHAGSTNTAGGLRRAIEMYQPAFGDRPHADDLVILLTDGQSNVNYWDTIPSATDLKAKGVKVMCIGIGLRNFDEVNAIASSTDEVYPVTSFESLHEIEAKIITASCKKTEEKSGGRFHIAPN